MPTTSNEYLVIPDDPDAINSFVNTVNTTLGERANEVDQSDIVAMANLILASCHNFAKTYSGGASTKAINIIKGKNNAILATTIGITNGGNIKEEALIGITSAFVGLGVDALIGALGGTAIAAAAASGSVALPIAVAIGTGAVAYCVTETIMDVMVEGYDSVVGFNCGINYDGTIDKITLTSSRSTLENLLNHNWNDSGNEHNLSDCTQWEISTNKDGVFSAIEFKKGIGSTGADGLTFINNKL